MKSIYSIVGMKFRPGMVEFVASLPIGEPLQLRREPDNKFDPNAVQVWARAAHVGYIKGSQAAEVAQNMDANSASMLRANLAISNDGWPMAEVDESPPGRDDIG